MLNQTLKNRYKVTAQLGRGAMGLVYRATDRQTRQEVAVKVIARELALEADLLARFRREGEALRQLRHRNIVAFVEMFEQQGQQVIVMEYVPGGNLYDLIRRGALPPSEVVRLTLPMCDALVQAHDIGIIHRDIKPENVLLTLEGIPKLTDFGIARLLGETTNLTHTGAVLGTPCYMSPEAWQGRPLDAQADVWSLGVMVYQMASGQLPFAGDTLPVVMNKILTEAPPDLRALRPETPEALVRIIERMLARDKAQRYETMRQVAVDLEQVQRDIRRAQAEAGQVQQAEARRKAEAEQQAQQEAQRAQAEARRQAEADQQARAQRAQEEARRQAEAEQQARIQQAQEEARRQAEADQQARAQRAQEEARRQAEAAQQARALREQQEARRAEEEARLEQQYATRLPEDYIPTGVPMPERQRTASTPSRAISSRTLALVGAGMLVLICLLAAGGLGLRQAGKLLAPAATATKPAATEMPATPTITPSLIPEPLTPIPTLGIGSTQVYADGMVGLYVPAVNFLMGSTDADTEAHTDEKPQHTVYLDAYWIDRTDVTNAMFARFVAATGYKTDAEKAGSGSAFNFSTGTWGQIDGADWRHPRGFSSKIDGLDDYPVVQVSWNDAKAYCAWAGRQLPTEAQWEKAARGTDGRKYPWGNSSVAGMLNFADKNLLVNWADKTLDDGYPFTSPVGHYPQGASPYGALDMAGNVWQWVADWYGGISYTSSPDRNPPGPDAGQYRVLRGGSWGNVAKDVRAANRYSNTADNRFDYFGFRCSRSP